MSQSAKNILISVAIGLILFLILAIGYNLRIIPISINVSNTIQSIQKQVDQIGIEFLGQIQIERAKMKELTENSFIVDSFASQIITDKVYSEVYEYTIRNKNCYGVTFVNNDKTIFFVYPPYASKRKGMAIASEFFNQFLTKEYSILPFQTSKEAQSTDEIVLGYPVQKDGKILGLALFHYSGTSLLADPIKKSSLSIKRFVFVRQYNMIVFNVEKELLNEKDKFSDILTSIEESNKTLGPIKVGKDKYYFFVSQIGKSGKEIVVMPDSKVGTPLIVQVVISFYLITIIILIIYVLLAFFFSPKEEEAEIRGTRYYKKPEEFEEIKNQEEEEEFLSAVSSEEKKKDFFFEEVKTEKPLDTNLKSLVQEVSQKKSPLEVTLDEEYVFTPPISEELPEITDIDSGIEKIESKIELPDLEEGEETIESEFEVKKGELPSLEELEESKQEIETFPEVEETPLGSESESEYSQQYEAEEVSLTEEPQLEELEIEKPKTEELEIEEKTQLEEFELPEEVVSIPEEMKELENMEIPELSELKGEEEKFEVPVEEIEQPMTETFETKEKVEGFQETNEEKLPTLEELVEPGHEFDFETKEEVSSEEGLIGEEEQMPPLEDFSSQETLKNKPETNEVIEENLSELPPLEGFEEESQTKEAEEFEIPPIEELEGNLPEEEIPQELSGIENLKEDIKEIGPIEDVTEELELPEGLETTPMGVEEVPTEALPDIEEELPETATEEIGIEEKEPSVFENEELPPFMTQDTNVEDNKKIDEITEEENEFFSDIPSDEIALSIEELENVSKAADQVSLDETAESENLENIDIGSRFENKEEDLDLPQIEESDFANVIEENPEIIGEEKSETENLEEGQAIEDLELPAIDESDFAAVTEEVAIEKQLPYDEMCQSFAAKYNIDAIAFFRSEGDVFTCAGSSDSRFNTIEFESDEPIIEKLSSLRKDIFIPEGINKFEPLLQKDNELFSNLNAMYVHGIFDEGQLLGAIFIFTSSGNGKEKEEYFHISTKLSELLV